MSAAEPDSFPILIASRDAAWAAELHQILPAHEVLTAAEGASAIGQLATRETGLILADFRLPDMTGIALLEACSRSNPGFVRFLIADYADLPEVVRARATGVIHRVIPKTARLRRIRKVVAEEIGAMHEATATRGPPGHSESARQRLRDLLRWTVEKIARTPGVVVRELPQDPEALQIQFVLPGGDALSALKARIRAAWSDPVKPEGRAPTRKERQHRVLQFLPDLSAECSVYAKEAPDQAYVYLAVLPWRRQDKTTMVLGIAAEPFAAESWDLLAEAHGVALGEATEFPIPAVPSDAETTGPGQSVLEYDWIVTETYVGPDRRRQPTSFLNRFVLIGRRRRVPSALRAVTNVFVDRPGRRVWGFAALYVLLSSVDTVFTLRFARNGTVQEINPILRPLLDSPALFLATKNLLALAGLFLVARFHLFRLGLAFLCATLAGYLMLDLYWVWLLAG